MSQQLVCSDLSHLQTSELLQVWSIHICHSEYMSTVCHSDKCVINRPEPSHCFISVWNRNSLNRFIVDINKLWASFRLVPR